MSDSLPVVGRGFTFADLKPGFRFRTHRRTISESDAAAFVNLTWLTEELFAVADDSARAIKGRPVPGALVYAFAEGLLAFLSASDPRGRAFDDWIEVVRSLPREQTRVLTWPLVTVFGFIAKPRVHMFLKPTVTGSVP